MLKSSNRMFLRILLSGLLVAAGAVAAGPHEVVGRVVRSAGASLGGIIVPNEGTILTGETLSTERGGNALVRFSANAQADLGEQTTVRFAKSADRVAAKVSVGTVVVEASGKDALVVETAEYQAAPADPGKAIYLVAVLPDSSTSFTARRGQISIHEIRSGKSYLLQEGYTAKTADDASGAPGQEKEPPKQEPSVSAGQSTEKPKVHKSNSTLLIIVAAGVAGGVGAAVAAGGGGGGGPASPSKP